MWIMVLIRHHTKKTWGRPSKPRKPSNILLLAAVRSHRQCRCHPPHHKYNFIPSRPVNHLQSYLRPNVGRGTALLLLYFFSAICTCTCPCHICVYLYMSVSSGLVPCHLLLLYRSSVIPLCPTIRLQREQEFSIPGFPGRDFAKSRDPGIFWDGISLKFYPGILPKKYGISRDFLLSS